MFLPLLLSLAFAVPPAQHHLDPLLHAIDGLQITKQETPAGFVTRVAMTLVQPLDHQHPEKGSFEQRIFLSHRHFDKPMVVETEGYDVRGFPNHELADLLDANLLVIEYRYYGQSRPKETSWQFLTNVQGASDHHRIIELFKRVYQGPWVSTGFSKGGESALIHRTLFPGDVAATICYDAPLILAREDARTQRFLATTGSDELRQKIHEFQRRTLQAAPELLPLLRQKAEAADTAFSRISPLEALEYAVLEYPFSYWQRGAKEAEIPGPDASPQTHFEHLMDVSGYWMYADAGIQTYEASFYQHMRELGYYGYATEGLEDLLVLTLKPDNAVFAPKGVDLTYNPELMRGVHRWATTRGNRVIYLYGETDTWKACAVKPQPDLDALVEIQKGGYHASKITALSTQQKQRIHLRLKQWLSLPIAAF